MIAFCFVLVALLYYVLTYKPLSLWANPKSAFAQILYKRGWYHVPNPRDAHLVWTRRATQINESALTITSERWLNRIHGNNALTNKAFLHALLVKNNLTHLQPQTFDLSIPAERAAFFDDTSSDTIWISKAPHLSKGRGIVIDEDRAVLRTRSTNQHVLAQRYITNPLLIHGKKTEIRAYWLLTNVPFRVSLYSDAIVRLASEAYDPSSLNNTLAHVLNTHQQKLYDGAAFHKNADDLKWSLARLAQYLHSQKRVPDALQWTQRSIVPQLADILRNVSRASRVELGASSTARRWNGRFELLGMDVILDDTLRPWLTEIQRGPGLSLDSALKRHVVPKLIHDMIAELDALRNGHLTYSGTDFQRIEIGV